MTDIEQRLERLPQDVPPKADLWSSIEHAISRDANDTRQTWDRLPKSIEPQADLWPEIASRIDQDQRAQAVPRPRRYRTFSLLAAGIACIAIGGLMLLRFGTLGPIEPDGSGIQASADTTLQDHIALVREQREAIETSMNQYPNDSALRELWRHAYATELQLIASADPEPLTI